MGKYSADELAELSDEELEGLKELEEEEGGSPDDEADPQVAPEEKSEEPEPEEKAGAKAEDTPEAEDEPADKTDGKDSDGDEPAPKSPRHIYEAPADLDKKLEALDKQIDELAQKFDDGELTAVEYRQQVKELDKDQRELQAQKIRAEVSHDFVVNHWKQAVDDFLGSHTQYERGSPLFNALDAEVRRLQTDADNQFDPGILEQAHKAVEAQVRKFLGQPDPEPGKDAGAAGAKKAGDSKPAGKKPLAEIPPTLAGVPAADITDTDGGEFSHLDRLADTDPEKFEAALARLSSADRDRYLASA